ncbi:MAG: trigger factor [Candidatus Saccharimonadales bacterium]
MKSTIKNTSDTEVVATIVVDTEELKAAEQVAAKKLAQNVKVSGFRKGKTPIAVAIKNIDPAALQDEILNNAISKAVSAAFVDSELQVIDRPQVEIKKYVPGESLEFTATVEILPKVKLGNYKKLKIQKEKVEVTKEDVEEVIERIRKGLAEKKEVAREAKLGDEAIIDFVGKKDDVAFDGGTGSDFALTLGSGQFIAGFEEGVVGRKAGDVFDLDLTFPADYGSKELKGAKVVFSVTLKTVKESTLPEVNDEFAAKVGPFKTVVEMKADIKRELTDQKERENSEKVKDNLITQLVAASHVPVPNILIEDQTKSIERDFIQNLAYQGLTMEQYFENKGFADRDKWIEDEVKPVAVKRVKAGLVLAELSKIEKIEATTAELAVNIEKYKQQYANNAEVLKQFEQADVQRDLANRLLTEKTVDRLVELNTK